MWDDEEDRESWRKEAACADISPDLFFSDDKVDVMKALDVCRSCGVRIACREYALSQGSTQDHGIWGATTEKDRRAIRRRRAKEKRHGSVQQVPAQAEAS